MRKNKIAIACQGGGSQTAFTAGVLTALFDKGILEKNEIVSLSGTSGGAVCAALAWYSLLLAAKDEKNPDMTLLREFWTDNSTQNFIEQFFNDAFVNYWGLIHAGMIPQWHISPSRPIFKEPRSLLIAMQPRPIFYDLKGLLEKYIKFDDLPDLIKLSSPALLIGAANVNTGEFKRFNSRKKGKNGENSEIKVEVIEASAAVPWLYPPVKIGNDDYWDGLFSENPPIDELIDPDVVGAEKIPDEILVIQVNPVKRDKTPETPADIFDRRNEMIGNVSLIHDNQKVKFFNSLLKEGAFTKKFLAKYGIREPIVIPPPVTMPQHLEKTLDYASKLDRSCYHIDKLFDAGLTRGEALIKEIGKTQYPNNA